GLLDHSRAAGGIDHDVCATGPDDLANACREILISSVECMSGTKLPGPFELRIDDIDSDNRARRDHVGRLHDVDADAADTEHYHRLPDLHLSVAVDHAHRGCHGAPEQRRDPQIDIRW